MTRRKKALLGAVGACALALGAQSAPSSAQSSVITATVADVMGVAIAPDGTVTGSSTVPMSVTREEYEGYVVVTFTPGLIQPSP